MTHSTIYHKGTTAHQGTCTKSKHVYPTCTRAHTSQRIVYYFICLFIIRISYERRKESLVERAAAVNSSPTCINTNKTGHKKQNSNTRGGVASKELRAPKRNILKLSWESRPFSNRLDTDNRRGTETEIKKLLERSHTRLLAFLFQPYEPPRVLLKNCLSLLCLTSTATSTSRSLTSTTTTTATSPHLSCVRYITTMRLLRTADDPRPLANSLSQASI